MFTIVEGTRARIKLRASRAPTSVIARPAGPSADFPHQPKYSYTESRERRSTIRKTAVNADRLAEVEAKR